jgi:hypothetical protein
MVPLPLSFSLWDLPHCWISRAARCEESCGRRSLQAAQSPDRGPAGAVPRAAALGTVCSVNLVREFGQSETEWGRCWRRSRWREHSKGQGRLWGQCACRTAGGAAQRCMRSVGHIRMQKDDCRRMQKDAEGCRKATEGCRKATEDSRRMQKGYRRFQKDAERLQKIPEGCIRLQKAAEGYRRLQKATAGCRRFQKAPEGSESSCSLP